MFAMKTTLNTTKEIRKAKKAELDEIIQIGNVTFDRAFSPFLGDYNVNWYINNAELKREIVKHYNDLYVLTVDDTIAGFIIYFDDFIHIMMIDSKTHHAGLGTFLLNSVEQELFKKNDQIKLQSFVGNTIATNFYLKNGWTKGEVNNANKDVAMMYFEKSK